MDMTLLLQQSINGLAIGSVYALVAIGLSLIWATARLLDFAFGEVFMLGGVITWTAMVTAGLPMAVAMAAAVTTCFVGGVFVQRNLYRRISDEDHVIVLAATIGVSMIVKDGATKIWGSETLVFPVLFNEVWFVGDIAIRTHFVFIAITAITLILILHTVISRTRIGMAMRAVAESRSIAGMMGVNVQLMLALAFGLSYLLAATAGTLIGPVHYIQTTGGTTMMITGASVRVSTLQARMGKDKVGFMLFPGVDGKPNSPGVMAGWAVGVSSKSKNIDLAGKFVEFMGGPEADKIWVGVGGQTPGLASTAGTMPAFFADPANAYLAVAGKGASTAGWLAPIAFSVDGYRQLLNKAAQDVVVNGMTPKAALERAEREFQRRNNR